MRCKRYAVGVVETHVPSFFGRWSVEQQDGRKRVVHASAYARAVFAKPSPRTKSEKIAALRFDGSFGDDSSVFQEQGMKNYRVKPKPMATASVLTVYQED